MSGGDTKVSFTTEPPSQALPETTQGYSYAANLYDIYIHSINWPLLILVLKDPKMYDRVE